MPHIPIITEHFSIITQPRARPTLSRRKRVRAFEFICENRKIAKIKDFLTKNQP
jgi:hypothetical protein